MKTPGPEVLLRPESDSQEQKPTLPDRAHHGCDLVSCEDSFLPLLTSEEYWKRRPGRDECPPSRPNDIIRHRRKFEELFPQELAELVRRNHYEVPDKQYMQLWPAEEVEPPIVGCITLCGFLLEQLFRGSSEDPEKGWEGFKFLDSGLAVEASWKRTIELRPAPFKGVPEWERLWHTWYDVVGSKREYRPRLLPHFDSNLAALSEADLAGDNLRAVLKSTYKKDGRKFIYSKGENGLLQFKAVGKAELDQALDHLDRALKALCPDATSADAVGEVWRDCYRPFVLKWVKDETLNDEIKFRWQLVDKPPKYLPQFDKPHRYQKFMSHGRFGGTSASPAVAHGVFHQRTLDMAKLLRGEYEHHPHGECTHGGECEPPTQAIIDFNTAAITDAVQGSADMISALRAVYEVEPRLCDVHLASACRQPACVAGHAYQICSVNALGSCKLREKPAAYVSPRPAWVKFHSNVSKVSYHKPNAEFLLHDGYKGNNKRPEWTKGLGKLGKLKMGSNGEYPFIIVDFEYYKATGKIALRQAEFKKAERPTKEQLEWTKRVTGMSAEPRGERFKIKSSDDKDVKEDESFHTGDDEEATEDSLDPHITDDGGTKEIDPLDHETLEAARRWRDAKAKAGEFYHKNDPAQFTQQNNAIKVNTKNKEFQRTKYFMQWLFENPTKDPDDDGNWIRNAAEATDLSESGLRTWFDRALKQIKEMEAMKDYKEIPDAPLTYAQAVDVAERGASYVFVQLNEWGWHKVDVAKHGTFDAALEAFKAEKMMDALTQRLKKAGIKTRGKTIGQLPKEYGEIFKDVKDRYDKIFHSDRIRVRHGWSGLISQLSEE